MCLSSFFLRAYPDLSTSYFLLLLSQFIFEPQLLIHLQPSVLLLFCYTPAFPLAQALLF